MTPDERKKREAAAIRKDVDTAARLLRSTMANYKKKVLKARSQKQAEDRQALFGALDEYRDRDDMANAYGWGFITEKEYDRLLELWAAREKYIAEDGKFHDRVYDMLARALGSLGDEYQEQLDEADELEKHERIHNEATRRALFGGKEGAAGA